MRKILCLLIFLMALWVDEGYAQTGIGTTSPHESAQLDVTSTDKGLLTPRMTRSQREGISDPAMGLLVYQTDVVDSTGFYYYDGIAWRYLAPAMAATGGNDDFIGFSAVLNDHIIDIFDDGTLLYWSTNYNTGNFDPDNGTFTVTVPGKYRVSAMINYSTLSSLPVLVLDLPPYIALTKNDVTQVSGNFPVMNVDDVILDLRTILGSGQVVLLADLVLVVGDELNLAYKANLPIKLIIEDGSTWSITKID